MVQYRNKSIAKIVALHYKYFRGVQCSWDYLEMGHWKGPCDGVGGALKWYADNAVKKGVIISNADDFFSWADANNEKMKCIYVTGGDVSIVDRILRNVKPLKGFSKCHSLHAYCGYLYQREMSCYKPCREEKPACPGWAKSDIEIIQGVEEVTAEPAEENVPEQVFPVYETGSIVEVT